MEFLYPQWPVPSHIKAAVTLRYSGLDLSLQHLKHAEQSAKLTQLLQLPSAPVWLRQTHGDTVIWADKVSVTMIHPPEADASIANRGHSVCAVLTADCLPILLCDMAGQQVAAIHAGWRGQVAGIIESTINNMTVPSSKLLAWLGPAIGPEVYEVGEDVYSQVMQVITGVPADLFFTAVAPQKWLMNLYAIAKFKLQLLGIPDSNIFGGEWCTYSDPNSFYSYRRAKTTKRLASLIWFTE